MSHYFPKIPVALKRINKERDVLFPEKMKTLSLPFNLYVIDTGDYSYSSNGNTGNTGNTRYITTQILSNDNSLLLYIHLSIANYPFQPPTIYVPFNINTSDRTTQLRYEQWCGRITKQIQKLETCNMFLGWVFSIIQNPSLAYGWRHIPSLTHSIDKNTCLCCSSITCRSHWTPSITMADITIEYLARRNFAKYCCPLQQKIIASVFNNDKWNLPSEVILYIVQQLDISPYLKIY